MGLDLSVVKNLKFLGKEEDFSVEELDKLYDDKIHLFENDNFFIQSEGMQEGFYDGEYDRNVDRIGWSYSGYNAWRKLLIEFAGYEDMDNIVVVFNKINRENKISEVLEDDKLHELKFAELCYFSDCEGFISSKTSLKLYKDFISEIDNYTEFIKSHKEIGGSESTVKYYLDKYNNLTEYFRIAGEENGAVIFH